MSLGSNVQHDDYLKVAKRIDSKCSHHKKEFVIIWHEGGVSYGNSHFAICKYIKSLVVHIKIIQCYMSLT